MSTHETSPTGKRAAFISGLIWGGLLGAAAVFFTTAPSGKKIVQQMQQESISLKGKSEDLFQTAKRKSIDLTHQLTAAARNDQEEKEQMIPIPKDY
ncbi:YtxH domain-containing protein [Sporolactobacillus terrae]|uniref:YtxH domain-containing protein n=1 Tax=Sporolactobacillus terrae TaxID=269673 RepID=A0A410DAD3_9BACL|nr:YtxH domain-containing protein [Sporolactobacillus terrae]QAA23044.1 YtxH domain-containing protein [Sporolactobacillus terrae]QAA26016.1 YtxH domain-containing protein [Sporolactobacillus terrae]UAK15110.1 YtxH domain-containing protein [Sporolactobacillus terrae]BBN99454.1 hypothetical protein St703_21590 [Sporolactobacillus terrae]